MATYNPFTDFNPDFSYYKNSEPEVITREDALFGSVSAPDGFSWSPSGNLVPRTTQQQEEKPFDSSFMNNMAQTHSEQTTTTSPSSYAVKNSKKAVQVMNKLLKLDSDLTPEQAAGIVGQINVESSLNFGNSNPNDLGKASKGAIQWNGDRFNALKEFAKSRSKSWTNEDIQLEFLVNELKTKFPQSYNQLKQATNAEDAAEALSNYVKYAGYDGTLNSARKFQKTNKLSDEQVYAYIKKEKSNRKGSALSIYNLWKSQS